MPTYLFDEVAIFTVGLMLMTIAAWKTVEANPNRPIPHYKRPENIPSPTILLRMVGYALIIWTVITLQDRWGLYAYLLFIAMILPEFILFSTHNRQLRQHEPPRS
ncbi:hypothetical protein [uncultured Corynebacterium sp.]|uniref:hypothetical protein n=1 Tax=uncultured Corynebacterium sp. TaxID=159447 RepID=UPI0025D516A3|nr:hypothetical protein [uncultured Corynebacterium sp.]